MDIPNKLSEKEESPEEEGLASYQSDTTEVIQNAAYENDGEESEWLANNADHGLDHENLLTESKFAEEIILRAFTKMYHWDMVCALFFGCACLNLCSQISYYSYNWSQTAYKLSMIRFRKNNL